MVTTKNGAPKFIVFNLKMKPKFNFKIKMREAMFSYGKPTLNFASKIHTPN